MPEQGAGPVPCDCGKGHKVVVVWSDKSETPCCSCTIVKYEALYGKPTFEVKPFTQ